MNNEATEWSTASAVGGGILAGIVVSVGCLLPIWLAGSVGREPRLEPIGGWLVPMLGFWAATSAAAASYCRGSSVVTALRAATLGLFGCPLALILVVLRFPSSFEILTWPLLLLSALLMILPGASVGALVARREFSTAAESGVGARDVSEGPHVARRFDWGKIWGKTSTVCGALGLLLVLLATSVRGTPEARGYGALYVGIPGLLLSTVAILVGLSARAGRGWILGLVAWLTLVAMRYLR